MSFVEERRKTVSDMPEWKKSPPEAVAFFDSIAPMGPGIDRRKMFGYPCLFANNNMFMGMFADRLFMRFSPADREEFMKLDGAAPFETNPGHIMKEYGEAPPWMLANPNDLNTWIGRSLEYALSLPPKEKKQKKRAR
jgi:TfoX/Sxy family transcriptional regulator of competence genes